MGSDHAKHPHILNVFFPSTGLLNFQAADDLDRADWVDSINKVVRMLHNMQGLPLPPGAPAPPPAEVAYLAAKAAQQAAMQGYQLPVVARQPAVAPEPDVRRGVSALRPAKRKPRVSAGGASGAPPEASFMELVNLLAMQAAIALGGYQGPGGERIPANPVAARYQIDLLEVLSKKTEGNLNDEEKRLLDAVLHELRMHYVAAATGGAAGGAPEKNG